MVSIEILTEPRHPVQTPINHGLGNPTLGVKRSWAIGKFRANHTLRWNIFSLLGEKVLGIFKKKQTVPEDLPGSRMKLQDADQLSSFSIRNRLHSKLSAIALNMTIEDFLSELENDDVQPIADYLNVVLHEADNLETGDGKYILNFLFHLAKATQVYPQCYILKGIEKAEHPCEGGGFADVYKGTHGDQQLCLKAIRLFRQDDRAQVLRSCVKELITWAHATHPNILPFYGVYILDEELRRICLVSPWMNNGNLRDYLGREPQMDQASRIPWISDILEGLLFLHGLNIIHGDLKAQNVLVSDRKRALIADFGLSTITTNSAKLSNAGSGVGGTPRWSAPELLDGSSGPVQLTKACDIWSFSCLCYEILTSKPPFYQYKTDTQVIAALQKGSQVPIQPGTHVINDGMWGLMTKCWEYVPRKRPTYEGIRDSLRVQNINARPQIQSSYATSFWEEMRARSDARMDYERIENVVLNVCKCKAFCRSLLSRIVQDNARRVQILDLPKDQAQHITEYLYVVLHETGIIGTAEGTRVLSLFIKLAKSHDLSPQLEEIEETQYDRLPLAMGMMTDVYQGYWATQKICVKILRLSRKQNGIELIRASFSYHEIPDTLSLIQVSEAHRGAHPVDPFITQKYPTLLWGVHYPWPILTKEKHPKTPRIPLISDIIAGLQYLHQTGIVHGDLKGSNILISNEGRALITDFGLVGITSIFSEMFTSVVSTTADATAIRWTAPELVLAQTGDTVQSGRTSDIWSFGCVCYEILTQKIPFYQYRNEAQVVAALARKTIPIRPLEELETCDQGGDLMWILMERCWDYDPENRPECAKIQQVIADMFIPDDRPAPSFQPGNAVAFWKAMRGSRALDYEHISDILLRIQQAPLEA